MEDLGASFKAEPGRCPGAFSAPSNPECTYPAKTGRISEEDVIRHSPLSFSSHDLATRLPFLSPATHEPVHTLDNISRRSENPTNDPRRGNEGRGRGRGSGDVECATQTRGASSETVPRVALIATDRRQRELFTPEQDTLLVEYLIRLPSEARDKGTIGIASFRDFVLDPRVANHSAKSWTDRYRRTAAVFDARCEEVLLARREQERVEAEAQQARAAEAEAEAEKPSEVPPDLLADDNVDDAGLLSEPEVDLDAEPEVDLASRPRPPLPILFPSPAFGSLDLYSFTARLLVNPPRVLPSEEDKLIGLALAIERLVAVHGVSELEAYEVWVAAGLGGLRRADAVLAERVREREKEKERVDKEATEREKAPMPMQTQLPTPDASDDEALSPVASPTPVELGGQVVVPDVSMPGAVDGGQAALVLGKRKREEDGEEDHDDEEEQQMHVRKVHGLRASARAGPVEARARRAFAEKLVADRAERRRLGLPLTNPKPTKPSPSPKKTDTTSMSLMARVLERARTRGRDAGRLLRDDGGVSKRTSASTSPRKNDGSRSSSQASSRYAPSSADATDVASSRSRHDSISSSSSTRDASISAGPSGSCSKPNAISATSSSSSGSALAAQTRASTARMDLRKALIRDFCQEPELELKRGRGSGRSSSSRKGLLDRAAGRKQHVYGATAAWMQPDWSTQVPMRDESRDRQVFAGTGMGAVLGLVDGYVGSRAAGLWAGTASTIVTPPLTASDFEVVGRTARAPAAAPTMPPRHSLKVAMDVEVAPPSVWPVIPPVQGSTSTSTKAKAHVVLPRALDVNDGVPAGGETGDCDMDDVDADFGIDALQRVKAARRVQAVGSRVAAIGVRKAQVTPSSGRSPLSVRVVGKSPVEDVEAASDTMSESSGAEQPRSVVAMTMGARVRLDEIW
uniref:HTH CENPB-type domain-containing protein n=1 Tax=Mycena chlorophos TaxID=658473 RepID=A0ABQ0LCX3_MYCCL|nr:predicted protein [Mycena chlorophos]